MLKEFNLYISINLLFLIIIILVIVYGGAKSNPVFYKTHVFKYHRRGYRQYFQIPEQVVTAVDPRENLNNTRNFSLLENKDPTRITLDGSFPI